MMTQLKGSLYNVMVEWETGEIAEEPLSIIATDDPVACAAYTKRHILLNLPGWRIFRNIARNQKSLTRAINQTKIRQVRRSATYLFRRILPVIQGTFAAIEQAENYLPLQPFFNNTCFGQTLIN